MDKVPALHLICSDEISTFREGEYPSVVARFQAETLVDHKTDFLTKSTFCSDLTVRGSPEFFFFASRVSLKLYIQISKLLCPTKLNYSKCNPITFPLGLLFGILLSEIVYDLRNKTYLF